METFMSPYTQDPPPHPQKKQTPPQKLYLKVYINIIHTCHMVEEHLPLR